MVVSRVGVVATVVNHGITSVVAVIGSVDVVPAEGQVVDRARGCASVAVEVLCVWEFGESFASGGETDGIAP